MRDEATFYRTLGCFRRCIRASLRLQDLPVTSAAVLSTSLSLPFFLSLFFSPPVPLSLFSKRNRFCSRSGSRRHRPTGTRRAGLELDVRPGTTGPGRYEETKRNFIVIFADVPRTILARSANWSVYMYRSKSRVSISFDTICDNVGYKYPGAIGANCIHYERGNKLAPVLREDSLS